MDVSAFNVVDSTDQVQPTHRPRAMVIEIDSVLVESSNARLTSSRRGRNRDGFEMGLVRGLVRMLNVHSSSVVQ